MHPTTANNDAYVAVSDGQGNVVMKISRVSISNKVFVGNCVNRPGANMICFGFDGSSDALAEYVAECLDRAAVYTANNNIGLPQQNITRDNAAGIMTLLIEIVRHVQFKL
jgi:hypothetical protein